MLMRGIKGQGARGLESFLSEYQGDQELKQKLTDKCDRESGRIGWDIMEDSSGQAQRPLRKDRAGAPRAAWM